MLILMQKSFYFCTPRLKNSTTRIAINRRYVNIGKFYQDCETCKEDLQKVVDAASDDKIIDNVKIILNGEAYCKGDGNCVQFIETYFSGFVKGLANHLQFQRIGTCSDLYGVCE